MPFRTSAVFALSFLLLSAQEPAPTTPAAPPAAADVSSALSRLGSPGAPQAYERVITKDAKSKPGIFTVHEVKERYYYEIPKTELNVEFLFVTQVARTTLGAGYGGQFLAERVVRWERSGNKINLREVNYDVVADKKTPISLAVKAANNDTIIMSFPIAAFGREKGAPVKPVVSEETEEETAADAVKAGAAVADASKTEAAKAAAVKQAAAIAARAAARRDYKETGREPSVIIDVTRLFTSDVFELSARQRLNATMMDAQRSYIERISPYPQNVEVEATITYSRVAPPLGATGSSAPNPLASAGMHPGSATVVLHHSMVKLPEHPMMPRVFDERVGYFSVHQMDFGRDEHRAPKRTYITRWRLEKKDPTAELSEPVKPIVYYIDAATPEKWVPYMIRGVESWQTAFEAAGFKHAIIAKRAPTPEQDPNFSPEDVRYSVIRWLPSTIENAVGPHISDPRTGEILNADIQFYHNVMNLQRDWYFLQVGPLDPRAAKLPLPDDLMGRLVEFVCAHEVGHTLGFQHNMKASSMYPQEKVRDKEWVAKMGHAPSIMDYSRFNYVAQPEDGIPVENLVPRVGPYDIWATRWGYTPITADGPDAEKPTLDKWAKEQDKTPWFRFSTPGSAGSDPGELTEAVGDADAIVSTGLGVKNLQRVAKMMLTATTATQEGEAYDDLSELYGRMLGQWTLEMNHVVAIVGGEQSQQKNIGQDGVLYTTVAKQHQAAAVTFLNENAFATPKWAIDKEILRRIEPLGAITRVGNAQRSVLGNLLSSPRFARLVEQQALDGQAAYAPEDLLAAVRHGVWLEIESPRVSIDAYRRQLQRTYMDLVNNKLNGPAPTIPPGLPPGFSLAYFASSGDEKPLYRAELRTLNTAITAAIGKAADRETRAHLEGARDEIARILDPKFGPGMTAGTAAARVLADQFAGFVTGEQPENCWPDYAIQP